MTLRAKYSPALTSSTRKARWGTCGSCARSSHASVPLTAYMDRHGSLERNHRNRNKEEQLRDRQEPTQVKRALDDLGVQVLYALSPQAKGRIERLWGTLQDRLVSELRLVRAATAAQANRVLRRYRIDHNARFAIPPQDAN